MWRIGYDFAMRSGRNADGLFRYLYIPSENFWMHLRNSQRRRYVRGYDAARRELERCVVREVVLTA